MARHPSIKLGAVNLVLQPHSPEVYVRLWNALFDLHQPVPSRGDQSVMLGRIHTIDSNDPTKGFTGLIFRFTTIDTTKPWFDIKDGTEADPAVVQREVRIPGHLCPNLATFSYRFWPRGHRLVFERANENGDGLSPSAVEKLLTRLASNPRITARFENIDVTMEQEKETIGLMLKSPRLKELSIVVKRPNPDDDSDADEKAVFGAMESENARKKTVVLNATRNQTLTLSADTKRLARVAKSNGVVEAVEEQDNGIREKISSRDHPQIETVRFNPNQQSRFDAFFGAAKDFLDKLIGN